MPIGKRNILCNEQRYFNCLEQRYLLCSEQCYLFCSEQRDFLHSVKDAMCFAYFGVDAWHWKSEQVWANLDDVDQAGSVARRCGYIMFVTVYLYR
jgi:hypothetical protein